MDIIITGKQGEGKTSKAEAIIDGLGRVVTITALTEEPIEVVERLKEVGAKGVIFDEIPDLNTLNKAVQTAQLYRDQTGINLTAVYCRQGEIINIIKNYGNNEN